MSTRIQFRRDTAANWAALNPILGAGEPAVETDTGFSKLGDGATAWTALPYQAPNAASIAATYSPLQSQVISAKDFPFYAKGDGTTDDTTAIQNAINSAAAYSLTIGKPTVLLPPGQYMVSHSLTGGTNGYFALRGTSKRATVITATSGFTGGYVLEAKAGFDVSDLTIQGNDRDGVYGFGGTAKAAGTGVLSVLYTPTVLKHVIVKNCEYGIRFSGEAQFPLKAIWDDVYVYGFRTAGIQIALGGTPYSGQTVAANDGQSAWSFDNIVCTNKGYSGSSIPAVGTATTVNSPDSTHDAVSWTGSDATEFGYVIMRRVTGSSDANAWTWVTQVNNGTTTYSAAKTAGTTYDYYVVRNTTGFYVRYPRAIHVGTIQAEYCGTGAWFEGAYAVTVGTYYYEWRGESSTAPTPIGNGITFSNCYGVSLLSAYSQYVNSLVVSQYSRAVHLDGIIATNAQRSAVHYMTSDATMTLELGPIVATGSPKLTTDGLASSNSSFGQNLAGEDPATVSRRTLNHPVQAEYETDYQGARRAALGADNVSGYLALTSGLPTASATYDGQIRRNGSRLYQCTNQGAGYAWYPVTTDLVATSTQVQFVTGRRSDNTQAASFGYDGAGQPTASPAAATKDFLVTVGGIRLGTTGPLWRAGTGSPEGVLTAPVGSLWTRTDGAAGTSLYIKETGSGNTGWTATTYDAVGAAAAAQAYAVQRANHTGSQPISTITGLDTTLAAKADLVGGIIPTAQIPALALHTSVTVASQAAMLALTAAQVQPGDLAIRTDGAGTFILGAADPSVLGNWTRLNAPTDAVTTVNGQQGTVVLAKGDIGLGNVDNTADAAKPVSTAQSAADAAATAAAQATSLQKTANLTDLASASAARTNLGLATVASTGAYADLTGTPKTVGYGFPYTVDPGIIRSGDALSVQTANQASYLRLLEGGTISKIGVHVVASSGNISLAVYSNSGTGRAAVPGTRVATTGAIACPAVGYQEIALPSSVTVNPGDWIAITADNITATFRSLLGAVADSGLGNGRQYRQSTAHPAPATPGTLVATIGYTYVLVGV